MGLWFNKAVAEHNPLNTTYLQLVLSWDLNKDFKLFLLYPYKELRLSSSTAPRFFQTLTMCETYRHAVTRLTFLSILLQFQAHVWTKHH